MKHATRRNLAEVAREKAQIPFHGFLDGEPSNLAPIMELFPRWNIVDADRLWCATFVYYCRVKAGFEIPYSPDECVSRSLAGCGGWEEYAMGDSRIGYHKADGVFAPEAGDIVLYDRVFCGREHDHIGVVLEARENAIVAAEGNFDQNISGIVQRPLDDHIRAFIRIPDGIGMPVNRRGDTGMGLLYCRRHKNGGSGMKLTKELVQKDLDALPVRYKTRDVDRLISRYVKQRADASALRPHILAQQQFHRIYFDVTLRQIARVDARMAFIHENLLFSDWWHTDQIIGYVADLDFDLALEYAKAYTLSKDPFIRRWGYVLFISKLCKGHAAVLLPLMHDDAHYYVQMGQAWLIAELAVHEPEAVYQWLEKNDLRYNINGKAIQKICDSFRIPDCWKAEYKKLRPACRKRK